MTVLVEAIQNQFINIRNNKAFELTVIFVIIFSALKKKKKTYDINPTVFLVFEWLDWGITLFFLIEIIIRMVAEKSLRAFFSKGWNVFDFVIVVASLVPVGESEMALLGRLLRVFRVLRLISIIPELRILLGAFVKSIPRMGYVSLLMFIIFYIYGAIGSMMFHKINPELWGNIAISILTMFRVATFEDWTDVMYETMEIYPMSWIFYLTFIFMVAFVFLNMMIGVVIDVMQKEHEKFELEQGRGEAAEVHWLRENTEDMAHRLERMESILERLDERQRR